MAKRKKKNVTIANPDELNKHLQYSSPVTWIALSLVILLLVGFFTWSFLFKIKGKVTGNAVVNSGVVTLNVRESSLSKLKVGQKVYISEKEGEILSFDENRQPVVTNFSIADGEYPYYVVIELKPISFLLDK